MWRFVLVLVLFVPSLATAQSEEEILNRACTPPPTAVVFANGMFTSWSDASDHRYALQMQIEKYHLLQGIEKVEYHLAYNENEALHLQLVEEC